MSSKRSRRRTPFDAYRGTGLPLTTVRVDTDATFGCVTLDRSRIRVKAMLIAPNDAFTAHAVSLNPPTAENPNGYHRLIGGSVELGESHRDAIQPRNR